MKKKILLIMLMLALFTCLFAITASAETPTNYIEFKVKLVGQTEYITAYTKDVFPTDPKFDFNEAFYSDIDFTQEITKSEIEGLDLSNATPKNNSKTTVVYVAGANQPYPNCKEIKWFSEGRANSIGMVMFQNWSSLESFDFGCAVEVVDRAFGGCGFKELVIPSTVTLLKSGAFGGCTSLKTLKIESNLVAKSGAFSGCTSLTSVDLGPTEVVGEAMFKDCTSLTSVTSNSVNKIEKQAFYNCSALTSFTFTSSLTDIGSQAFYNCSALTSSTFTSSLTNIGSQAFCKSAIVSVTIPSSVTAVGNEAFANCGSLTTIVFEEGFKGTLGSSAFMSTSAVTTLTLVEGITSIPSQCFWTCGSKSSGIDKVTLPDSVTTLAGRAFNGSGIKELEIRKTSKLSSITGDAFAGMKSIKSIYLPTGVVISCDNLFQYCHNLEEVENFENVVINIKSYGENVFVGKMFYECQKLKEIKIPHSVTAIAGTAWRYYALERVYIPASVTSINKGWFDDKTHFPTSVIIFYCDGNAEKLLSLTNDGSGNVSSAISNRITAGSVCEYSGLDAVYAAGVIVNNANTCDVYYGGVHFEKVEDNNPCYLTECSRCTYKNRYVGNDNTHDMNTTYAYPNGYFVNGQIAEACQNEGCIYHGAENARLDTETLKPLFAELKYSAKEDSQASFGLYVEYKIMQEAIALYKSFGKTVSYGVVAIMADKVSGGGPLNNNGTVADGVTNVVAAPVTSEALSTIKLIISGPRALWTGHAEKSIYIAGYATDGESLEYLGVSSGALDGNGELIERNDIQSIKSLSIKNEYTEYTPKA